MGWKLDKNGNLHPDEERMFAGIVKRFKHHKNIMWGIEENVNKLPKARTSHFMKLRELIAQLYNHHHISKFTMSIIMCREAEKMFR